MNAFTQSSIKEREHMERVFLEREITKYSFTDEEGFCRHDGQFTNSKGQEIIFEVKVRNVSSTKYRTTVIEESKFDYLLDNRRPAVLFIFFTDGKYLIHKLSRDNKYYTTQMLAPRTTAGYNDKVLKTFIEIPIKDDFLFPLK